MTEDLPVPSVRQTAKYLSGSLRQLPADGGDVSGVGGEPLLAVIQSAALCRPLDPEPQTGHCALRHRLHVPEQDRDPQDHCP